MYSSLILSIVVILILWRFIKRQKIALLFNELPGPPTLPGFGNFFDIIGKPEHFWKQLRRFHEEYGPNYRLWTPVYIAANINDPDDVEIIMTNLKMIKKNQIYDTLKAWLGEGLLTSSGKKWQTRRKILTPAFHFNILKKYFEVILEQCDKMVGELKLENGPAVRNLEVWLSDHTLNIICETAMGIPFSKLGKEVSDKYKNAVHTYGAIATHRVTRPWLIPNVLFYCTSLAWTHYRTVKILHDFSTKIINERKSYHKETGGRYLVDMESEEEVTGTFSAKKRLAMLDLLIAAYRKGQIDDSGMREEVDTFVFEGYDTTALALCYSILCLAEFSDHQTLAREEIELALKESDGEFTMATVQKFTYLERCIKEAIRLYPSVPFLGREVLEDLHLKNHVIPAGCIVNIYPFDVHRNPKHWPNPEKYDPDRFLPENMKGRHPFAYIPFSGGFRNCIGQKFAMLELKTSIGHILHNFTIVPIETTKDIELKCDIVLRSVKPLRVKLIPLEKK